MQFQNIMQLRKVLIITIVLVTIIQMPGYTMETENIKSIYVATNGNDTWSGLYPEPLSDRSDGPLATIEAAKDKIRKLKITGQFSHPITVWIRGGRYHISQPMIFSHQDSGPVIYRNFPGETVVLDCGVKISGWKKTQVNGVDAWVTEIQQVKEGKWYFRQLFVNGKRKQRTRLPETGFFRMKDFPDSDKKTTLFDGSDCFYCHPGNIRHWKNFTDVEIVVFHWWIEERMPLEWFDENTGLVKSSRKTRMVLRDDKDKKLARYWVENVFEQLKKPSQWYLDRQQGLLYYIPEKNEEMETSEVYAPLITQAIRIEGNSENNQYVEYLTFKGLTIEHAEWQFPDDVYASSNQAASNTPAVIHMKGARFCAIEDCEIKHCGLYGIEIGKGCSGIKIHNNHLEDLGAGGIKINGGDANQPDFTRTKNITITGNHIHNCGNIFYSAAGILSMHASDNIISNNHIHDLYYSGISCGWVWGYGENVSKNNIIENNIIHDIGKGLLSDMGGIYTLGVQPGTVIRGNIIYRVEKYSYGGWCIYLDEGSSHIIVENNLCAFTNSHIFHVHYGRENFIRNNIFAFGKEGIVAFSRKENHRSFTIERNIFISKEKPFFFGGYANEKLDGFLSDLNILYDVSGKEICWGTAAGRNISLQQAQNLGHDVHSIVADPGFVNPQQFDFTLKSDDVIKAIGFRPFFTKKQGDTQ
ncbi:MAG TPA: right-handed parallel beta-helix repeat-containing protein [bacterium]|nr:right-handed parallel beta-helix repeat-containing protein [bacterium]HOL35746.1 right-handed parallel beta-helix repeat-containing protein [bacterium]HPP09092.1 right-handed parallel beta-helix repeat-containing protein [bacterium]